MVFSLQCIKCKYFVMVVDIVYSVYYQVKKVKCALEKKSIKYNEKCEILDIHVCSRLAVQVLWSDHLRSLVSVLL